MLALFVYFKTLCARVHRKKSGAHFVHMQRVRKRESESRRESVGAAGECDSCFTSCRYCIPMNAYVICLHLRRSIVVWRGGSSVVFHICANLLQINIIYVCL